MRRILVLSVAVSLSLPIYGVSGAISTARADDLDQTPVATRSFHTVDEPPNHDFGYIGLLGGVNSALNTEDASALDAGLTVGVNLTPSFNLALIGSFYGQKSAGSLYGLAAGNSAHTAILAAQASYVNRGFHVGGEAGAGLSRWPAGFSSVYNDDSLTSFVYGPVLGYDYKFAGAASLGVEAHYWISRADAGANNLQVLAALKYWP